MNILFLISFFLPELHDISSGMECDHDTQNSQTNDLVKPPSICLFRRHSANQVPSGVKFIAMKNGFILGPVFPESLHLSCEIVTLCHIFIVLAVH